MFRSARIALFVVSIVWIGGMAPDPCAASDPALDALRKQVEALEARMKTLEVAIQALATRAPAPAPAPAAATAAPAAAVPAAPSASYEAEAQALIQEVIQATDQGDPELARAKLAEVRTRYGASKVAGQATYFANEIDVIGKGVPSDWGISSWFQGKDTIDLSGKPTTLVVFWEEWCPHCRDEMPKLQSFYAAHRKQGLQILGLTKVTQTSTDDKVTAFLKQGGIEFPVGKESGVPSAYFNVKGIPAAALVKDGKIVWRGHPIRLTPEILKRWL
jgi:thiol-disulfide isomerase/thioredoxin